MNDIKLGLATLALSFAALSYLNGCIPSCAEVVNPGVDVSVTDKDGVNQPDAKVTYSYEGGAEKEAECHTLADKEKGCETWGAFGQAGHYVVKAESADGKLHAEAEVTVEKDFCGPVTEDVTLVLK